MDVLEQIKALKNGSLLMLETLNEKIVGNLKTADIKFKRIELINAKDVNTSFEFKTPQIVALSRIKTIKLLKEQVAINSFSSNSSDTEESPTETPNSSTYFDVQLKHDELEMVERKIDAIVYISQVDVVFDKALADMSNQQLVGLLVEPSEGGCRPRVIVMATSQAVYFFDISTRRGVYEDLKLLLESERPRKVVHNSSKAYAQLRDHLDVHLNGVYDTFVAHCLSTGVRESISLVQLLYKTFKLSASYFEYEDENAKVPNHLSRCPIPQNYRTLLAKLAIFQLKLQEHQLHSHMLAKFYNQSRDFSRIFGDNTDRLIVAMQMQPHKNIGFRHIQPNGDWRAEMTKKF